VSRERRQSEGVPTLECLDIGRGRHGVAIIVASPEVSASCLLAQAIGWADAGAPFALIAPGPYSGPRRTPEMPDVAPPAA
jgi:hypothetical protein